MHKPRETAADKIWKEALESRASEPEVIVVVILLMAFATVLLLRAI